MSDARGPTASRGPPWTVLAALVVAIATVGTGLASVVPSGLLGAGPPAGPSAAETSGALTVASDAALASQLSAGLVDMGRPALVASVLALPLAPVQRFLAVNLNPDATTAQVYAADRAAYAVSPATDWWDVLAAAAGGCATGAVVGGLIGAAAAGAFGDYLGQNEVKATNGETFEVADAEMLNELRLVLGEANAVDALLPATSYFWGRLADVAAESQIGNSTWNATLDLNQSTVASQLGTITNTVLAEMDEAVLLWESFAVANGECIELFGESGNTPTTALCLPNTAYIPFGVKMNTTSATLLVPNGAYQFTQSSGSSDGSATCYVGPRKPTVLASSVAFCDASTLTTLNYTVWSDTTNSVQVLSNITGGGVKGGFTSSTFAYQGGDYFSLGTPFCATSATCNNYDAGLGGFLLFDPVTSYALAVAPNRQACVYDYGGSGSCVGLGNASSLYDEAAGLEYDSVATGQAYWGYLRDLGYRNPSGIPPTYAIIPPALALPDDLCVNNVSIYGGTSFKASGCVNLNSTELFSLYLSELASMARFFTSANYTTGTANANETYWGNLYLVVKGDVYLPNATPQNASYSHEVFWTPATWTILGAQLILFPVVQGATLTVNKTWEVPSVAPMQVDVIAKGPSTGTSAPTIIQTLLNLAGNGTSAGKFVNHTVWGDALYPTSCVDNGTTVTSCDAAVYTVNVTAVVLSCSTGSSACPTPTTTSSLVGCSNAFIAFFADLFGGCSSLGTLLSEIIWVVIIVVVAVLIVWAVFRVASNPRR